MITQAQFDAVGKRIAALQQKHGGNSPKLANLKLAYQCFVDGQNEENFVLLENEVKKLEDEDVPDMAPVFMNIS